MARQRPKNVPILSRKKTRDTIAGQQPLHNLLSDWPHGTPCTLSTSVQQYDWLMHTPNGKDDSGFGPAASFVQVRSFTQPGQTYQLKRPDALKSRRRWQQPSQAFINELYRDTAIQSHEHFAANTISKPSHANLATMAFEYPSYTSKVSSSTCVASV